MARVVAQPTLTQQARSLLGTARTGVSLLRTLNQRGDRRMFSSDTDRLLGQGLGGLDVGLGALGIYNTINDPHASDLQKAARAGSGALQAAQGIGALTGAYSVPYGDVITAGLSVADIAGNK